MRDAENVVVQRAIVHLIDHLNQKLTHSDDELPLDANEKLRDYFSDQVRNALSDNQTSSARFSAKGNQSANDESYKILKNGPDLISSSRELGRLLMEAMGEDARIKPETSILAVCVYTASNYRSKNFLALIKIDPTEALVEKIETINGKQIVTFDVLSDVMPTKEVKLRKAALIAEKGTIKDLDLLLLDRQVSGVAANFFALDFLNTVRVLEPASSTESFIFVAEKTRKALMKAKEGAPHRIGPKQSDAYMQHLEQAVRRGRVNRDTFAKNAPVPKAAQKILAKRLRKEFPEDKSIKLDSKVAEEILLQKTRYRGDYGFLLEVDNEYYKKVVKKIKADPPLQDGTIITRIELAVPNLHLIV
jgi:hypothetical protein